MERNDFKVFINQKPEAVFVRGKAKNGGYICPRCGNGSGRHRTGATSGDGKHYKCFSCGLSGDIIGIYMELHSCNYNTAIISLADEMGISLENDEGYGKRKGLSQEEQRKILEARRRMEQTEAERKRKEEDERIKEYASQVQNRKNLHEKILLYAENVWGNQKALDYLHNRGLTDDTIKKYKLGFCSNYITIPYGGSFDYLICRSITTDEGAKKYRKSRAEKYGKEPIFYGEALQGEKPVFIVEGVFDALTIMQEGFHAVATNTNRITDKEIKRLLEADGQAPLIICMDNDQRGREGQAESMEKLKGIGRKCFTYTLTGSYKDINDRYRAEPRETREALKEAVKMAIWNDMEG